jgi:cyclic-di-GMP phosphodiesterase, flagellum assembly factor TipF
MLAQRLDAHNKAGSLLSAVNGPSITNAEFLEAFARVYEERDRISNQLVLTFTQADVEQFSSSAWQALSDMHAFGFRFALSSIDHVAMDFASLASRGFAFLRLDANALLKGLPSRERFIGPDELCQHLAGAGMTLVADTIDDEAIRARVFGFGVLFGQGRLFGGARQVKLDPLPSESSAAA